MGNYAPVVDDSTEVSGFSLNPAYLMAGGGILSSMGSLLRGNSEYNLAQYQAAQLRQNAGQVEAASQRTAYDVGLRTQLITSRALAVAAASGGGASDPTVMNIIANTHAQGAYQKSLALYGGEEKAREMEMQAEGDVYSGEQARTAGYIGAAGGLARSAGYLMGPRGGLLAAYGGMGPGMY